MLSRVTGETIRERSKRSAEQSKCRNVSTTDQTVRSDCPTVSKSDQVQGTLSDPKRIDDLRETQLTRDTMMYSDSIRIESNFPAVIDLIYIF